jgi:cysteine synthase A
MSYALDLEMDDQASFRGRIYESVLETVGATPLVRLPNITSHYKLQAELLGKLEFFNPLSSAKDRIGLAMIEAAEAEGLIDADTVIIEPSSGNTGIALAFVCAARRYRLIVTMSDGMSVERRMMLRLLGAEVELTPAALGIAGAIARAEDLCRQHPNSFMPLQFANRANPAIHRRTTAIEIWRDSGGRVDYVVAGVGSGGTLTGIASMLKAYNPRLTAIAVEPLECPVLSGGKWAPHRIQGIGVDAIPAVLDCDLIDEIARVPEVEALAMARLAARLEGLPIGISAGAALQAAITVAQRPGMAGKVIVVLLPDGAERYISTALFEGYADAATVR